MSVKAKTDHRIGDRRITVFVFILSDNQARSRSGFLSMEEGVAEMHLQGILCSRNGGPIQAQHLDPLCPHLQSTFRSVHKSNTFAAFECRGTDHRHNTVGCELLLLRYTLDSQRLGLLQVCRSHARQLRVGLLHLPGHPPRPQAAR